MIILGLTGLIGSGKSSAAITFRSLGCGIVDGDAISRALTAQNGAALPALREAFGDGMFDEKGCLLRKKLGSLVFRNAEALGKLNRIMQPLILEEIHRRIREMAEQGPDICVLDMPLLFEENLDRLCDVTVCVTMPEEERLRRIMQRDGCTREEALSRSRSMWSQEKKAERADHVLDNGGTPEELDRQVLQLFSALKKGSRHV